MANPYWEKTAAEEPEVWSEPQSYKAMSLLSLKRTKEAKAILDEMMAIGEQRLQAAEPSVFDLYLMGLVYRGKGQPEEARRCFQKALAKAPDFREAKFQIALFGLK